MCIKISFYACIIILSVIVSCEERKNASAIQQEAVKVFMDQSIEKQKRLDSSLRLTDKALNIEPNNISALQHQYMLFAQYKDLQSMVKNRTKMIQLLPHKPLLKVQLAHLYKQVGEKIKAEALLDQARNLYQLQYKKEKNHFDFLMEYDDFCVYQKDTSTSMQIRERIKKMTLNENQKQIFNLYLTDTTNYNKLAY